MSIPDRGWFIDIPGKIGKCEIYYDGRRVEGISKIGIYASVEDRIPRVKIEISDPNIVAKILTPEAIIENKIPRFVMHDSEGGEDEWRI